MSLATTTLMWAGLLGQLPAGWQTYTSTKGGFTIAFPGKPSEVSRKLELGDATMSFTVAGYRKGVLNYMVASTDVSGQEGDPVALLDHARDSTVKSLKGKLTAENPIELSGNAGRSLEIEIPRNVVAGGGVGQARLYLIGTRLYELSAVLPAKGLANAQDFDAFFKSFKPGDAAPPSTFERALAKKAAEEPSKPSTKSAGAMKPASRGNAKAKSDEADQGISTQIAKHRGWRVFEPKEGGMRVELPLGRILRDESTHENSEFGKVTTVEYKLHVEGIIYQVTVEDFLGGRERSVDLQKAEVSGTRGAMLLMGGGGIVMEEKETMIAGFPACEFQHEYTGKSGGPDSVLGIGKGKVVCALKKLFAIQAIVPKGAQVNQADVDAFLNSFEVLDDVSEAVGAFASGKKTLEINDPPPPFIPGLLSYSDPAGLFTIMFPSPPGDPKVVNSTTPDGKRVTVSTWTMDQGEVQGTHTLVAIDFPRGALKGDPSDRFNEVAQIFTTKPPGTIEKTQEVKLVGLPGRDYVIKLNSTVASKLDFVVHLRVVATGDRIYAIARTGARSLVDLEGARFIDTFRPTRK